VASGYLTAASAGAFGAALAKLFASDRAHGRYGTDGMFAGGVRISVAGARPAPAPRERSVMHTLTVRGIDAAGQPANGGGVIVANVDAPKAAAHQAAATVPSWWYCSFAGNHNCAAQPLPVLSYTVGGLALNGTTAPGTQSLAVTVGHLQLALAQKITDVTVQASFNGGKTWTSAAVTGSGGSYQARFAAPARSYVTLRVTAAATTGAQVSETITRAYAIGSSPGARR
jgi:hypothetical protein